MESTFVSSAGMGIPLIPVTREGLDTTLARYPERWRNWVEQRGFEAKAGGYLPVPSDSGMTEGVLVGHDVEKPIWTLANVARRLEPGVYRLEADDLDGDGRMLAMIGWGLGGYRFDRYKQSERPLPRLLWPEGVDRGRVEAIISAHFLARDLINTPASDMMPGDLAGVAETLAASFGARIDVISDEETLATDYPCVHAVGHASASGSRVIELAWGDPVSPHVVIVGKGVCFDSGGLNVKPGNSMRLMKKDMGGAAIAMALARAVMALNLPIRITLLIGAVENALGSRAFRPGDVLTARNGKTVEIDNTDAEGRLVLADLLVRAGEIAPDLVIDFATLTGAARVAVGTEVAAFFSTDSAMADSLTTLATRWDDPVWPLPLHRGYRHMLNSDVADMVNSSSDGFAGAITAALFLKEFMLEDSPWLHFDVMAWNTRSRPGRPKGGEAMGLRASLDLLESLYGP